MTTMTMKQHEQVNELRLCGMSTTDAVLAVTRSEEDYQTALAFIASRKG